jgi:hypothetical protein
VVGPEQFFQVWKVVVFGVKQLAFVPLELAFLYASGLDEETIKKAAG